MYIKEIELKNFKSFGRKVVVPLHDDFIAITGPNGSGKSNIVDALLFALSLSNSRVMRAERLTDLIYRGDNGKNPDFTQVTVKLDNTCRTLPIEKNVIEISRKVRVKKDNYYSDYYINGDHCGQAELRNYLSKAGINSESYNVVMQGDVTRIIETTPVDRRKIVDEIAGVAEFDENKRKALAELEVVKERIDRLDVILEEVGAQLTKLKEEKDKALTYQAQRDEKRRQEAFLLLAKLREADKELADLEKELENSEIQLRQQAQNAETQRDELTELERQLNELNSEITYKGEDEQIEVKQKMVELKGEIEQHKSKIEMVEEDANQIETEKRANYLEMGQLQEEAQKLASDIRDAAIRKASLQADCDELMNDLEGYRTRIAQADAQYAKLRDSLVEEKGQREKTKTEMSDMMRERDRYLDAARRKSIEREENLNDISDAEDNLNKLDREESQLEKDMLRLNEKAGHLEEDKDDLDSAKIRLRREMAVADEKLQRLQLERAKAEARLKSAQDGSGYSRGVETIRSAMRQKQLHGLHGTIAELGEVKEKYATALEVAAGARLQSVVADSDEDAARAIERLKKARAGRVTFLPLNKMRPGNLSPPPNGQGVVDYALNLVQFNKKFLPAFWYVFRDTLVVQDLGTARRLMGKYRMVTLDGGIVERSGAMTGGYYQSRLKFAADESKKLDEISIRLNHATAEREDLLEQLDHLEEQIFKIKRESEDLSLDERRISFRREEIIESRERIKRAIKERKTRLKDMEDEGNQLRGTLKISEENIRKLEMALSNYEKQIGQLEKKLSGSEIPELTSLAEGLEEEIRILEGRIRSIESEITQNDLKKDSNSRRTVELTNRRKILESKKAEALEKKTIAAQKSQEAKTILKELEDRSKEIEKELHGLKGVRSKLLDGIMSKKRYLDSTERDIDRIKAQMSAAQGAAQDMRHSANDLRSQIESCGVDASTEPPKSQTIMRKIKTLEKSMRDLEPVNMLAIEEHQRVSDRQKSLMERRETLSQERTDILEKLDRYEQMKKEAFMSAFMGINQHFGFIFNQLSGGEGELILDNPEDPLSGGMGIRARPARKSFHRLEAMSGGEKSLTALSFIFAIQQFRPAPFYALDEIDMFLDGSNVERVAKLVKNIAQNAQFIVVSLRKPMIQEAKYVVGVAMQENNISSVTGVCLN